MPFRNHSTKRQMREFGERVKRFRILHNMSQGELAKAMGVGHRTVQNVEGCHFIARYSTILKFNRLVERYAKKATTEFTEALNDGVQEPAEANG